MSAPPDGLTVHEPLDYGTSATARTYAAMSGPPASLPRESLPLPLAHFLDHYLALAGDAPMPARTSFDPVRVPKLLANLILWDVPGGDSDDYRCRLAGTEVCRHAGRELRGETLAQMHGEDTGIVRAEFDAVRTGAVASYVERTMNWVDRPYRLYRRLLLPFAADGRNVDMLMGAILFEAPQR